MFIGKVKLQSDLAIFVIVTAFVFANILYVVFEGGLLGKYLRLLNIGEQFSLHYQINGNDIVKKS